MNEVDEFLSEPAETDHQKLIKRVDALEERVKDLENENSARRHNEWTERIERDQST